ncbi:transmembrane protein [gut metagenome]|uniref:Transmembrane protein n=1 Tax=gut metagenome TaxID=749906 RepID=J9GN36_9ZZZZ
MAVIGFIFLRSKREEKSLKRRSQRNVFEEQRPDVLMDNGQTSVSAAPTAPTETLQKQEQEKPTDEPVKEVPQDEPPIYEELEKERQKAAEVEPKPQEAPHCVGVEQPRFDYGVQWILEMSSIGEKGFSYGAIEALYRDIQSISSDLPVELWIRSTKDGLYYDFQCCPSEANRILLSVLMANRTTVLNEETASKYLQAMEQVATYNGTDVRPSVDLQTMLRMANKIARFVKYFDNQFEILLVPRSEEGLSLEAVDKVAKASGFVAKADHSEGWEFRFDPQESEPVLTLSSHGEPDGTLHLAFDIPLSNPVRGDLKQFFQMANHLASHLGAAWVDCKRQPIHAGGAMILHEEVNGKLEKMAASGVRGGSTRAKLIFSRRAH